MIDDFLNIEQIFIVKFGQAKCKYDSSTFIIRTHYTIIQINKISSDTKSKGSRSKNQ